MRQCPSVEGTASPLITHRIGADVCMARQSTFFHKCHRCIYRGQAANWEPEVAPMAMINVHAAEEPVQAGVKVVKVPAKPEPKTGRTPAVAAKATGKATAKVRAKAAAKSAVADA